MNIKSYENSIMLSEWNFFAPLLNGLSVDFYFKRLIETLEKIEGEKFLIENIIIIFSNSFTRKNRTLIQGKLENQFAENNCISFFLEKECFAGYLLNNKNAIQEKQSFTVLELNLFDLDSYQIIIQENKFRLNNLECFNSNQDSPIFFNFFHLSKVFKPETRVHLLTALFSSKNISIINEAFDVWLEEDKDDDFNHFIKHLIEGEKEYFSDIKLNEIYSFFDCFISEYCQQISENQFGNGVLIAGELTKFHFLKDLFKKYIPSSNFYETIHDDKLDVDEKIHKGSLFFKNNIEDFYWTPTYFISLDEHNEEGKNSLNVTLEKVNRVKEIKFFINISLRESFLMSNPILNINSEKLDTRINWADILPNKTFDYELEGEKFKLIKIGFVLDSERTLSFIISDLTGKSKRNEIAQLID